MTKFAKLSDDGRMLAVTASKQGGYVRIAEASSRISPLTLSGGGIRRLVEAFKSLPERSRNLVNVESVFAQIEAEESSPFEWVTL